MCAVYSEPRHQLSLLESEYGPDDKRLRATIDEVVIGVFACTSLYVFVLEANVLTASNTHEPFE
jgi:hypothetical protein